MWTAPGKLRPLRPRSLLTSPSRSCAELLPRARRSLPPAQRAGPRGSPPRPAPALLAGHPAGARPARGRRVTVSSSGAAQRRGRAPGTDARPSALRGGRGSGGRVARASGEQALWPTPYRTPISLEAAADKVCKDRVSEVNSGHGYNLNLIFAIISGRESWR